MLMNQNLKIVHRFFSHQFLDLWIWCSSSGVHSTFHFLFFLFIYRQSTNAFHCILPYSVTDGAMVYIFPVYGIDSHLHIQINFSLHLPCICTEFALVLGCKYCAKSQWIHFMIKLFAWSSYLLESVLSIAFKDTGRKNNNIHYIQSRTLPSENAQVKWKFVRCSRRESSMRIYVIFGTVTFFRIVCSTWCK